MVLLFHQRLLVIQLLKLLLARLAMETYYLGKKKKKNLGFVLFGFFSVVFFVCFCFFFRTPFTDIALA